MTRSSGGTRFRDHGPNEGRQVDPRYRVMPAQPSHLGALAGIELAAAQLLAGHAPAEALTETTPLIEFQAAQRQGRLWVALLHGEPVGFALVKWFSRGHPHLEEMDVLPGHGRRGVGTALLLAVLAWVREGGMPGITLTTFRGLPWNMPFYLGHGFEEVPRHEWGDDLLAVVADEARRGLDPSLRAVLRFPAARPGIP